MTGDVTEHESAPAHGASSSPAASRRFVVVVAGAAFGLGATLAIGGLLAFGAYSADTSSVVASSAVSDVRATTTTSSTTTSTTSTTAPPPPPTPTTVLPTEIPIVAAPPTTACEGVSGCLFENGIDLSALRTELAGVLTSDGLPTAPDDVDCQSDPQTSGPNRVRIGESFNCTVTPDVNGALTLFIVTVTAIGTYSWEIADV